MSVFIDHRVLIRYVNNHYIICEERAYILKYRIIKLHVSFVFQGLIIIFPRKLFNKF